jgi:hypothetical protein
VALVYSATVLTPPKLELVAQWLVNQPWSSADGSPVEQLGTYRFDDPGDKVGIDTMILRLGDGRIVQVPATYRDAPLEGGEAALIGTTDHSILGKRWVYDGCADPVWVTAMATAILTGGSEAVLDVAGPDGSHQLRAAATNVRGTGSQAEPPTVSDLTRTDDESATTITAGDLRLVVRRTLDRPFEVAGRESLTGAWPGLEEPTVLAVIL